MQTLKITLIYVKQAEFRRLDKKILTFFKNQLYIFLNDTDVLFTIVLE